MSNNEQDPTVMSFKASGHSKSGDTRFEVATATLMAWDGETGKGIKATKKRGENHYIPLALSATEEIRKTIRQNAFAHGDSDVESFDVELRIVNVKRKASAATGGASESVGNGMTALEQIAFKRELFIETGDVKGLTALFKANGMTPAEAKRSAESLIG